MIIKSVGIDPSTRGSCFFELNFDSETLEVVSYNYYLFNTTQKLAKLSPNVIFIDPNISTVEKIDNTVRELEERYLTSNQNTLFTVERFVPSSAKSMGEDWKGIYSISEHYLRRYKRPYKKIYPTTLKKYATNNGRAEKTDMGNSFTNKGLVKVDLSYIADRKNDKDDPKSNVYDAYFLAEVGYYLHIARCKGLTHLKDLVPSNKYALIKDITDNVEKYE